MTLTSDAGWAVPFCIKFWTSAPKQAYFAGWDGETWTHCAYDPAEPTKLKVQFDDHRLTVGELRYEISYHFAMADFPDDTEDEVLNRSSVVAEVDGMACQVVLDFQGETAPDIQFALPAYANEAQRIANEETRIEAEQQRVSNEESRIAAEETRQQNEQQRISLEQQRINQEQQRVAAEAERVSEFARQKTESEAATAAANSAAILANEKAQLAADKAALAQAAAVLAQAAAVLANEKAQLAADKAALAQAAAALANDKAALAQQKADYAKAQGDYAKEQGDTVLPDHERAESDHDTAVDDHTTAASDHTRAESDHTIADADHNRAESDHTTAVSDHNRAESDHTTAVSDHTRAESDHTTAVSDYATAAEDHTRAEEDHTIAAADHTRAESDHSTAVTDHETYAEDVTETKARVTALEAGLVNEHTRAEGAEQALQTAIEIINGKIPAQATASNQLADKDFVNSSISTATADFKGTYNSLQELEQVTANANDYAFVIATDAAGNTVYKRYKWVDGTGWTWEYDMNNSSFTAAQWAAIQSGITAALVTKLSDLPTNAELNQRISTAITTALGQYYTKAEIDAALQAINTAIGQKQDIITDLADIRSGAAAGATALQPTALTPYSTTEQMNAAIKVESDRAQQAEQANADAIAALQAIVADIETIAEGYVRVAGSSSPALSYKSYKYHEQGGFGRESVFSLFYPCLVGTKLSGDDAQVGTILFVLKKLGARLATAEDTAFTGGQAVWEDINGNLHAIDGSEGDVMVCNVEPYYSIDGRHTIDGTEYDVFLKSRTPFTWQGIDAVLIDKMGMSPDYCVSHQDEDGVTRMHSAYNLAWNGSYSAPVGVVGKFIYATDEETGEITETYDADTTLLGGAGGLHSTGISLPDGEQRAMNQNPDTTLCYPFMNQTAEACNRMQALLLSEGGTFDAHNANLMGSGFSTNDGATAAGDWEQAGSGAKNGMRFVNSQGQTVMRNFGYLTANTAQSLMLNIQSLANMINSWRNPWHIMEAYRAVCHAIQNDVHELEWFTFEGNKYKYRSVSGFAGPSQGEATCVVWKMLSTKFTDAAKDPADGTTSLEGNRVDFLVSTALLHGVTTQVSPSWWVSGLIFTEDENGQYECYIERDQHALLKSPSGDYAADQVIPFEEHYEHIATIQKSEGYARNYSNEALMMPDTDANKSGGGLHTYVGKYNWFTGGNAPAGKRSVRGFRRGFSAYYAALSPLSMYAAVSPSYAYAIIGFGTCCSLRNG